MVTHPVIETYYHADKAVQQIELGNLHAATRHFLLAHAYKRLHEGELELTIPFVGLMFFLEDHGYPLETEDLQQLLHEVNVWKFLPL